MQAEVTLGLDASPFAAAISQAESKAQSFSSKVGRLLGGGTKSPWDQFVAPLGPATSKIDAFEGRIAKLFRRDPTHRAELAISESIASLASGDVGGAITSIASRISGLGLAAGVGVGAAIAIFSKLKGQINETEEAAKAVNAELSKPFASQAALGPEGITKEIDRATTALDLLTQKRKTFGSQIQEAAIRGQPDYFNTTTLQVEKPDRVPPSLKAAQEETRRILELTKSRADYEDDLLSIKEQSLRGDERAVALAKISLDVSSKRADILLKARPKPGTIDPLGAAQAFREAQNVSREGALDKVAVDRRFDIKKAEADVEAKILELKKAGLSAEEQTTRETQARIALLRYQLGGAPSEERRALQNKIAGLQQTLPSERYRDALADQAELRG